MRFGINWLVGLGGERASGGNGLALGQTYFESFTLEEKPFSANQRCDYLMDVDADNGISLRKYLRVLALFLPSHFPRQ